MHKIKPWLVSFYYLLLVWKCSILSNLNDLSCIWEGHYVKNLSSYQVACPDNILKLLQFILFYSESIVKTDILICFFMYWLFHYLFMLSNTTHLQWKQIFLVGKLFFSWVFISSLSFFFSLFSFHPILYQHNILLSL